MKRKLLLLLFILCLLPATNVWAQTGTYTANGVTWKYKLEGSPKTATITGDVIGNNYFTGVLDIPSNIIHNGNSYTVTKIGDYAFYYYRGATEVKFPLSLTIIGFRSFEGCVGLTSLDFKNVTEIKNYAFNVAKNIVSINLSNIETIGDFAFSECNITGKLIIPGSVKEIGGNAFSKCNKITSVDLGHVVKIGLGAFVLCTNLTGELVIPKSVTTLGNNAFGSMRISSVRFETGSSLNSPGRYTFSGCNNLKYVDCRETSPSAWSIPPSRAFNGGSAFDNTIPYCLVYLPAGSAAAAHGEENFIIGNTCDNFVAYDEYEPWHDGVGRDYSIIHPFMAIKASYKRVFRYANYKTLYLPYSATLPDGMRAYTLEAKTTHGGKPYFRFVSIGDGGTQLQANKPYLVRIIDGPASKQFGIDVGVQVPVTPPIASTEMQDTNGQGFYFGGTTENIDNATAAGMKAYNLINNQWRPIRTDNPNGYIHSFRAYMRTTGAAPAKGFAIVLDDEDTPTGIDDTVAEDAVEQGNSPIYTLDGKLMGTDIDALPSGEIYIKNGKKFYKF